MSVSACPAGCDPPVSDRNDRGRVGLGLRAAFLALLALFTTPAFAQTFPKFTGLVVDAANVLPADRKAGLQAKLEDFQKRTGRQLVVATIPDLQGYAIEDYGYRLGRNWGVGLKDADNGAILIVAPKDRKVRIEVGRRLEPVLTDAFSSVIVQTKVLPAFKAGDLPAGVDAGAGAIMDQLGKPDAQAQAEAAAAAKQFDAAHKKSSSGGLPIGLIFWGMVIGFVVLAMARRKAGGRRYRATGADGGGSNWPIWLWAASELLDSSRRGGGGSGGFFGGGGSGSSGGSDGSWGGGGFTGGGGGDFGGGGASGDW